MSGSELFAHLDADGRPCTRHLPVALDSILQLATVGARMPSFHHDVASKLQGLMMALDEITELVEPNGDSELGRATETAHAALRDLTQIFMTNRTLTKPPVRTRIALRELVQRAGERVGVTLRGELPEVIVEAAAPMLTHGFALALDAAAGAGRSRSLAVVVSLAETHIELALEAAVPAPSANESLALAGWVFAREGGSLRCRAPQIVLQLPVVA